MVVKVVRKIVEVEKIGFKIIEKVVVERLGIGVD